MERQRVLGSLKSKRTLLRVLLILIFNSDFHHLPVNEEFYLHLHNFQIHMTLGTNHLNHVSIPGGFTPLFRRLETIVPI